MNELLGYFLVTIGTASVVWFIIFLGARAVGWARKGSPAAAFIGWALLLLSAGMNPQRPPQEQVEDANRQKKIKKDSQSGDPKS